MRLLSTTETPAGAASEQDAALLRAAARNALERLGEVARQILRRQPGGAPSMDDVLAEAADSLERYCACTSLEVDGALRGRGGNAALLSAHLHGFRARQRVTLLQLAEHVRRAPHSAGVAHGVVTAAVVLVADLDSHARDMALVIDHGACHAA